MVPLVFLLLGTTAPALGRHLVHDAVLRTSGLQAAERAARDAFGETAQTLQGLAGDLDRLRESISFVGAESLVQTGSAGFSLQRSPVTQQHVHALGPPLDDNTAATQNEGTKGMLPMVGLLKGMYDSWKEKIGQANKHEQEQKQFYEKTMANLEAKKAKAGGDSNATETYDRIEKYWKRQREISHRQYHTALKIMHSGMERFKSVEKAMANAVAGKKPTASDLRSIGMQAPEVVLLQQGVVALSAWVKHADVMIRHVRSLSEEDSS